MTEIGKLTKHKTTHQDAGDDEISVEGLAGDLADAQESTWDRVSGKPTTFDPAAHKTSHQDGGADEIDATGLAGRCDFVDRGDPAAYDFTATDFIYDTDYHSLDLSSIIPVGAKAVLLYCYYYAAAAAREFRFRKNGNVNSYNLSNLVCQVANVVNAADIIVPVDSDRKVAYYASPNVWPYFNITVKGWFI